MDTSFFGIGMPELLLIAVIALIVLGPERIPGAMREVAKWAKQVRDISNEFQNQFSDEIKMLDEINPRRLMNDVMDPKANPAPGPVTPPSAAAGSAAAGAAAITGATTTVGGATVLPPGVSLTNGEPSNSILPPSKADASPAQPDSTSPAPAEPPPSDEASGRSSDGAVGD